MAASSLPIVLAGTLAVHLIVIVVVDVMTVVAREPPRPPAPKLGLIDVKTLLPPPPPPEAPPPPAAEEPAAPPPPTAPPRTPTRARAARTTTQPRAETPPPTAAPRDFPTGGGDPVVTLPDIAPVGHGVPAAVGRPSSRTGRGGGGRGDGEGSGAGAGSAPPPPVSIAAIKTPAKPKGDFDYLALGKDYPAEAKRLGIEGELRARLVVDATGRVTTVRLLGSLGHGLDELALARARKLEFEPARDANERPVPSVVVWTFTFTLPT